MFPPFSESEEPASTPTRDRPANVGLQWEIHDNPRSDWNDSCDTTIRDSESVFPDVVSQKPLSLFPPPDEIDEVSLSEAPKMEPIPLPPRHEELQNNRPYSRPKRRDLVETTQKLQEGCDAVVGTRLKAHERRSIMRRDRQTLSNLDARFMQGLRNVLLTSQDEKLRYLLGLCEQMQTLRDKILPKEDDYNILEDQLNSEEFELGDTCAKLLGLLEEAEKGLPEDNDTTFPLDEDVIELERATSIRGSNQRPEVLEYLSRVGDRDIAKERLVELRHTRPTLVEEEKSRARFDMVLDEGSQKFLTSFNVRHEELQEALAVVETDLARLRKTLDRNDRVLFASTRFDDVEDVTESDLDVARHLEVDPIHSTISYPHVVLPLGSQRPPNPVAITPPRSQRDPLLLAEDDTTPTFDHLTMAERRSLTSIQYINAWLLNQQGSISADAFLNDWLLNVLRTSLSELYQYKSTPTLQRLEISQEGLRDLVLEWWFKDEAAGQYLKTLRLEARGMSLLASAAMSSRDVQSDTVVITLNQLSGRLYRNYATLQLSDTVKLAIRHARSI